MFNSLRDAIRHARHLGATVAPIRRTGELRFSAPGLRPLTHNARRKDSSRELRGWIDDLIRLRNGGTPMRAAPKRERPS